jgi:DNA-binding MarR family transcriptional regulator
VEIALTAAGASTVERAMPAAVECDDVYLEGVSKADAEVARRVVNRIYENARRGVERRRSAQNAAG